MERLYFLRKPSSSAWKLLFPEEKTKTRRCNSCSFRVRKRKRKRLQKPADRWYSPELAVNSVSGG